MHVNVLQAEKHREFFFTNSHVTIDLQRLEEKMEYKIATIKVGLRHKAVHYGKQTEEFITSSNKVRATMLN